MKKFLIIGSMVVFALLAFIVGKVNIARADGVVEWDGNGAENLPCEFGGLWILAPAPDVTSATLTVNGHDYGMTKYGNNWKAESDGYLDDSLVAYVTYTGDATDAHLQLSHCIEGDSTPTPCPTNTPTATPEDTPTMTPTEKPTDTPTATPTSTEGPSPTPTDTPTATATATEGPSPTPTMTTPPTMPPTPTSTDGPTETPKPPVAAVALPIKNIDYPSKIVGTMHVNNNSYVIYFGVNAQDGTLLLPTKIKGGALYNNQIWLHRAWNSGWFNLKVGDTLSITFVDGKSELYKVTDSSYEAYGKYFNDGKLHIITCYGLTTWEGVEVFDLELMWRERSKE
jgi:hypothetical protein